LTKLQRADLRAIFAKQEKIFSGKRGHYPFKKMHLELIPGAQPVHAKTYPVSRNQLEVFQKVNALLSSAFSLAWVEPSGFLPLSLHPRKMDVYIGLVILI
jgi:hypothetical protein